MSQLNSERLTNIYKFLYGKYGPQKWWPAETSLECILGAILTQNTSWKNVEKALSNLNFKGKMSISILGDIEIGELAQLIRPSGYFNQKAKKIKNFVRFVNENYSGSLDEMFQENTETLRTKLLGINGIGPETADSILLYAGRKPVFVVDAYTYRILSRHQLIPEESTYQDIQEFLMDRLKHDHRLFNEYHALLVRVGKEHCRKREPVCDGCPLQSDPHVV